MLRTENRGSLVVVRAAKVRFGWSEGLPSAFIFGQTLLTDFGDFDGGAVERERERERERE